MILVLGTILWTAAGCIAATFANRFRGGGSLRIAAILSAASPLAALSSYALLAGGPALLSPDAHGPNASFCEMLIYGLLAPLPFGLLNGSLFGAVCGLMKKELAWRSYAASSCGALLGGIALSSFLAHPWMPLAFLALFGATMPLISFIAFGRKQTSVWSRLLCALFCLVCMLAAGLLGSGDRILCEMKWARELPGYVWEAAFETASGRAELLKNVSSPGGELEVYRNRRLEAVLPKEREPEFPAALFGVAQPSRGDISVLLACPPFSRLGEVLDSLPPVAHVELLCPDVQLAFLASRILPANSDRIHITFAEPRHFIESSKEKYDLIMVLGPTPETLGGNRFFTLEFFKAVAARLNDGGVYVGGLEPPASDSTECAAEFNGILGATLHEVFKNQVFAPEPLTLFAAGNGALSANFD